MSLSFLGKLEVLAAKLECICHGCEWKKLNESQFQLRHPSGAIINWYPSTGTILFQGKNGPREDIENLATRILKEENDNIEEAISEFNGRFSCGETVQNTRIEDIQKYTLTYNESEIIIGLVGAIGAQLRHVSDIINERLRAYNYTCECISISRDVMKDLLDVNLPGTLSEFERVSTSMDIGNEARKKSNDYSILALGAASLIHKRRIVSEEPVPRKKQAYVLNSLKHPHEVRRLREIYAHGFYLIGVYSDRERRHTYLTEHGRMTDAEANDLIARDEAEVFDHGQHTSDCFHQADFFIHVDGDRDKLEKSVWRILDLLFKSPFITPTFDEYAMFMAFTSSLRSADLSRQVGAVIANENNEIVATGANDCPKYGGGLYWPYVDDETKKYVDVKDGRDYMRGFDSNVIEKNKIIEDIVSKLDATVDKDKVILAINDSKLNDITEYGRVVHAEMEAILMCARNNATSYNSTLYCTTFPCHNCAKHIVASGIKRVVYVEPYPKSKALDFHTDSLVLGRKDESNKVIFEPFVGVGPRKFFDLFSMKFGIGSEIKRKCKNGQCVDWEPSHSTLRIQLQPLNYIDREAIAIEMLKEL
jgi:deoxycytidylate deaminase